MDVKLHFEIYEIHSLVIDYETTDTPGKQSSDITEKTHIWCYKKQLIPHADCMALIENKPGVTDTPDYHDMHLAPLAATPGVTKKTTDIH